MDKHGVKKFFYWINERHRVYKKREAGKPWPWTKDTVLQQYKFTNVFRHLDRVSVVLTRRIQDIKAHDTLWFHIAVFRMFNWPDTYDALNRHGLTEKWSTAKATKLLSDRAKKREQIFTGAYIITNNGSTRPKIELVCESLDCMYKSRKNTVWSMEKVGTLEGSAKLLMSFPMVGNFVAYELVSDLRHTPILCNAPDIMTWANPGPGAQRGIRRLMSEDMSADRTGARIDYLGCMRELLKLSTAYLGTHVPALEMRDIEHSLCEFDKYMRVVKGEGRPRSRFTPPEERGLPWK